tara:strand:- start:7054 stop:7443 length:390 start_codon:yes stop_codon:yes gene_type:complete
MSSYRYDDNNFVLQNKRARESESLGYKIFIQHQKQLKAETDLKTALFYAEQKANQERKLMNLNMIEKVDTGLKYIVVGTDGGYSSFEDKKEAVAWAQKKVQCNEKAEYLVTQAITKVRTDRPVVTEEIK